MTLLCGMRKMNVMTTVARALTLFFNFLIIMVQLQTSIIGLTMVKCLLAGMLTWTVVLLRVVLPLLTSQQELLRG